MTAVQLAAQHILGHLTKERPLFVALQGPQGSGKSYLSVKLREYLKANPHDLNVVVLSIDDLYLPHDDLVSLAVAHPENKLWNGRGQPGTHDIALGVKLLSALKAEKSSIELPWFDKSLFDGEGDRIPMDGTGTIVTQPPRVDIVIFEGWCVGFQPLSEHEIRLRWDGIWKEERQKLKLGENEIGRLTDLESVNESLKEYLTLWNFFDVFVQLKATPPTSPVLSNYAIVYKWRLEQEHNMKATNGGRGMSDLAVKSFVDRYIPGYVFFGNPSHSGDDRDHLLPGPKWVGKALTLYLNETRTVAYTTIS